MIPLNFNHIRSSCVDNDIDMNILTKIIDKSQNLFNDEKKLLYEKSAPEKKN